MLIIIWLEHDRITSLKHINIWNSVSPDSYLNLNPYYLHESFLYYKMSLVVTYWSNFNVIISSLDGEGLRVENFNI